MDSGGVVNHLCGMCVCVTGLAASSTKAKVCVSIIRMATQLHERTCIFSQSVLTLNVLRVRAWWGAVGRIRGGSDQCVLAVWGCWQGIIERECIRVPVARQGGGSEPRETRPLNVLRIDGSVAQKQRHKLIKVATLALHHALTAVVI